MSHDFRSFKRVVVYRIGSLGDTLVVLPAFHLVRRAFPDAHITLLTNIPIHAKAAPMEAVLGSGGAFFDDVMRYPVSMRSFDGLRKLRAQLSEGRYDCLVYLASPKGGLATSIRDYFFFRACGIPVVLGVPFSRAALQSLPIPGTLLYTSRTSRATEALKALGTIDIKDPGAWDLRLTADEIAESEALLGRHGIMLPFLAVSAGTKMPAKDWEEANWAELLRWLAEEYPDLPLVLIGVSEERERSERLMSAWKGAKANLCGLATPRVSAAVLRSAKVMISHDSGPMHLAATMGVPCVAIFSARAKPGEWFPRGDNHVVIYHKTPCWDCGLEVCTEKKKECILSITVDEVCVPVVQQLARRGVVARSEAARQVGMVGLRDGLSSGVRLLPPPEASHGRSGSPRGAATEAPPVRKGAAVLLVGNYVQDAQQSMQRFVAVLEKELAAAGTEVISTRPEPFLGRLRPAARGIGKWLGYFDKFVVFPRRLKRLVRTLRAKNHGRLVVHVCDHSNAFYTRVLQDVPFVLTCHDLLAVRSALGEFPRNPVRWSGRLLQRMTLAGLKTARQIACVSDATRRDLCRLVAGADSRTSVVKMGLNNPFAPVHPDRARAAVVSCVAKAGREFPPDARYLLHVGDDSWYKNRDGLVFIFSELRRVAPEEDFWLIMAGRPLGEDLLAFIDEAGLRDRVVALHGVSHEDLCAIYSAAELLLFPSWEEGFGWPIIEAQACGCPVVTTGRPPMNDIGGDAAAYLDPAEIGASLDVLLNVLYEDDASRRARIERGFANAAAYSTAGMIARYLALYSQVIGNHV